MALFCLGEIVYNRYTIDEVLFSYEGKVVVVKKSMIKVLYDDGNVWWHTVKQQRGLCRTETDVFKTYEPRRRAEKKKRTDRVPVSQRWMYVEEDKKTSAKKLRTSTYCTQHKSGSKNKEMCRQILVAALPSTNVSKRALVLDAEDMQFSRKLVVDKGFRASNIDVPNCNGPEVIDTMTTLGLANVHPAFLGDFVRRPSATKYDVIFLDYCGQVGSVDKINSPLHDIQELFLLDRVASTAVIGLTVCLRSSEPTKILYQNMHRASNALISAAFTHGFVATIKTQTTYTDAGAQTMCFCCVDVHKI